MQTLTLLLALAASSSAPLGEQQTGEILVVGQTADELEILVEHTGTDLATLLITDGLDVERVRVAAQGETRHTYLVPSRQTPLQVRTIDLTLTASNGDVLDTRPTVVVDPVPLPGDEPSLTLTDLELRVLKKSWRTDGRVKREFDRLIQRNDRRLSNRLLVPKTGGAWVQLYRCPDTHVRLEMIDFNTHRSPATGRTFSGSPYDEAITTYRHKALGIQAFEMALCYQLTGDTRYAERAEEILLCYAHLYPTYQLHDRFGTTKKDAAKAFSQTLEEAQWLIELVQARDLLRGSGLIDEYEDHAIRTQLFEPAVQVIKRNEIGIYNIQNWHNTAIFLASLETGNLHQAREAVFGPVGLTEQLTHGVNTDGLWMEGSIGYHFFTIRGMLPMIHAIKRTDVNVDLARLQDMFTAPFELIQPDYTLPALNDGATENFEIGLRDEYEQALALFPNVPRIDDPLVIFGRGKSLDAILWGATELGQEDWHDVTSVHFNDTGLGVLREGGHADRSMAIIDYGKHGGYHGHYDKLGLTLWLQGKLTIRESGADGYGQPISENFFRSSLGHSTVVVDGQNQNEAQGTAQYFSTEGGQTISTEVAGAYPGVTMRRLVHLTEEGDAADMFEAVGSQTHTFDYVLHGEGTVSTNLTLAPASTGFSGAYDYLSNVQSATTGEDIEVSFTHQGKTTTLHIEGEPGTTVFLASAPGAPLGTTHPLLIVRRTGERAVFATAFSEGAGMSPGFGIELNAQGWEATLDVYRPGVIDARRLRFETPPNQ